MTTSAATRARIEGPRPAKPKARSVVLLAETSEGGTVGIRFANVEMAEEFERRNRIEGLGIVPIITQAEAALAGFIR